ncbi:MAG: hypothetical protein OXG72_12525 [Acidobacteria bacterium]|nr:hypothetical protein [Acidobacteriota bacterium]
MPLIDLLRPDQRAALRRLRKRIANRENMRRYRSDLNYMQLCPGVDLPLEAGTCGRLIWPESTRCTACRKRRDWLLTHALVKAAECSRSCGSTTDSDHPPVPSAPGRPLSVGGDQVPVGRRPGKSATARRHGLVNSRWLDGRCATGSGAGGGTRACAVSS